MTRDGFHGPLRRKKCVSLALLCGVLSRLLRAQALPLLKAAYDRGLNTWDTANVYSNGLSEEIIGRALKKYEIPREKVVLMTKIWSYIGDTPSTPTMMYGEKIAESKDFVNQGGKLSHPDSRYCPV